MRCLRSKSYKKIQQQITTSSMTINPKTTKPKLWSKTSQKNWSTKKIHKRQVTWSIVWKKRSYHLALSRVTRRIRYLFRDSLRLSISRIVRVWMEISIWRKWRLISLNWDICLLPGFSQGYNILEILRSIPSYLRNRRIPSEITIKAGISIRLNLLVREAGIKDHQGP